MTAFALTGATILVGTSWTGTAPGTSAVPSGTISSSTDISAFVTSIEVSMEADELDTTSFSSGGWRTKITSLAAGSIQLTFNTSFAASNVDALFGLGGTVGFNPAQSTAYFIDVKPTSASRSSTNPSYVAAWLNTGLPVLSGSVGDLAQASVTFPFTGRFARLTS